MKILKNNYNQTPINQINQVESYPRTTICENCGSELEYEKSDLRMGEYGSMYIDCPLCGYDNMLEDNENSIILTVDNIEFPLHFHHVSVETGAVDVVDKRFKESLYKAVNYFRENKEAYDWGGHLTGNLYLQVHRYSGDEMYEVVVSNDFYIMEIPFEPEDY